MSLIERLKLGSELKSTLSIGKLFHKEAQLLLNG